ncbi:muts domain V-domain-containing protein [Cokeromyces recurvatus]|uniref:muts domain V-domain-containing protein n=1 Tax=Cokeromyces recurvatus TaxID=90255 RepID=UPI002220D0F8|nr:muts domain V-domain-containing protein [Cokeromyces recurvatus]KAI7898974.1 muts domain V-domain-containing protein [Cokeromyces recurvatus]
MEVCMCLHWKSNRLGCSYFSSTSLELYLMEDVNETEQLEYTTMLIAQILPTFIIISDAIEQYNRLFEVLKVEYGTSIEIKKVPAKDFMYEKGHSILLNWYIQHMNKGDDEEHIYLRDPDEGNKTHAYLHLEGILYLDESRISVGCAGVLLKHLQEIEREERINDESCSLHEPTVLKTFSNKKCMHINSDTIKSLCIFDLETHPNMHQKREKERLSLFGLLDKTKSVLGKQLLKEWLSRPTQEIQVIADRHATIHVFSKPELRDKIIEISSFLKHIKNINRLLSKLRESKATPNDWQSILKFAYYTICIFGILNQLTCYDLPIIQKAKEAISMMEVMKELGSSIDCIIDFEASKEEARIIVKAGIDHELDLLREKYNKLDDYLLQVSQEVSASLPVRLGSALNVVYFPQLGYLITLPQSHLQRQSEKRDSDSNSSDYYQQYLVGFELQFTTLDNLYYKNDKTKELDKTIGDIHALTTDKEIEIIQELSEHVLKHKTQFTKIVHILSEIDCLISFTMVALKFNYVQPVITEDDSLVITQGRHPLQELCVDIFIANDTQLKGGQGFLSKRSNQDNKMTMNSIQVVTGANFSGKSVYLKQIALIVYMAHIGSFVPAESARIGIVDKLFTRIQTSETVSKPQSAFGFDLQQLNRALIHSTKHSLVIIDEFGKGTESIDGAALFCSVLGYFLAQNENCPKIVASTHFHDLISQDFLSAGDGITISETEIISHNKEYGDEVAFLYRIIPRLQEHKESSYGIWCASIAGLPNHILERASDLCIKYNNGERINRIEIEQDKQVYKQLEIIQKQFLEADVNEINPYELIASIRSLIE